MADWCREESGLKTDSSTRPKRGIQDDLMEASLLDKKIAALTRNAEEREKKKQVQEYDISKDEGAEGEAAWDIEDMYENMDLDDEYDDEATELLEQLYEYIQNRDPEDEFVELDDETMELLKELDIQVDTDVADEAENCGNKTEDNKIRKHRGSNNGGHKNLGIEMDANVGDEQEHGSKKTKDGNMRNGQGATKTQRGQRYRGWHRKHRGRQKAERGQEGQRRKHQGKRPE